MNVNKMLTAKTIQAIGRTTGKATGLPNQAYTDVEFLNAEREHVFAKNWACIGFESAMPESGHAAPIVFLALPLLAVRDDSGTLRIFHNVCSHRGQLLVREACKMHGGLRCPYHSWNYAADGELRGTPHIGGPGVHDIAEFDRGRHGLKQIRSHTRLGLVFVNLSGDAPALDDYLAPLIDRWEGEFCGRGALDRVGDHTRGQPQSLTIDANWKLAVENFCEAYHLPWIHPKLNRVSRLEDHYNITLEPNFAGQGSYAYTQTGGADTLLPVFPDWPREKFNRAEYLTIYPNVLLGLHADHTFAIIIEPLACDRTTEHWQLFYVDQTALGEKHSGTHQKMLDFWREVFNEDIDAVEGLQKGRESPGFQGGAFTPVMDVPTHHFHRWVANHFASE